MAKIIPDGPIFKYHEYALYEIYITFQKANRTSGNHKESKKYFSNKQKIYSEKL